MEYNINCHNKANSYASSLALLLNSVLLLNHSSASATDPPYFTPEALAYAFSPDYDKKRFLRYLATSATLHHNAVSDAELELYNTVSRLCLPPPANPLLSHVRLKELIVQQRKYNTQKVYLYNKLLRQRKLLKTRCTLLESQLSVLDQRSKLQLVAPNIPAFDSSLFASYYSTAFDHNHKVDSAANLFAVLLNHYSSFQACDQYSSALSLSTGATISALISLLAKNIAAFYNSQIEFNSISSFSASKIPFAVDNLQDFAAHGIYELDRVYSAIATLLSQNHNFRAKSDILSFLIATINQITPNYDFASFSQSNFTFQSLFSLVAPNTQFATFHDFTSESSKILCIQNLQSSFYELIKQSNATKSKYIVDTCIEIISSVYNSAVDFLKTFAFDKVLQINCLVDLLNKSLLEHSATTSCFCHLTEYATALSKQSSSSTIFSSFSNKLLMHNDLHFLYLSSILTEYLDSANKAQNPVFSPFSLLLSNLNKTRALVAKNSSFFSNFFLNHPKSPLFKLSNQMENFAIMSRIPALSLGSTDYETLFIPITLLDRISDLLLSMKVARALNTKPSSHYKILEALFIKFYQTSLEFKINDSDLAIKVVNSQSDKELAKWITEISVSDQV
ncbi:hypothetical protein BB561_004524 [Smittium simulii]|uniref:Uncharacterized protein n=1 Tax=Smittium simulii TaxID=133385 RepID=A0A2T9YFY1_9FUNG|nr:hypothetical protein BB561_004524 [Smittium simulii]